MSQKIKALSPQTLRSFGELPKDLVAPPPKAFFAWDNTSLRAQSIELATRALAFWLDARFADLVRERVHRDSIVVRNNGSKTTIYVDGVARFEFKLKMQMEKCHG